jgi:hypothetical protein
LMKEDGSRSSLDMLGSCGCEKVRDEGGKKLTQ